MNTHISTIRPRIIADTLLFFVVLYAPWWITSVAVLSCVIYFKNFYEAFFFGFLFDMLYGADIASFRGFRFVFSSCFLFLIAGAEFIKREVRV